MAAMSAAGIGNGTARAINPSTSMETGFEASGFQGVGLSSFFAVTAPSSERGAKADASFLPRVVT